MKKIFSVLIILVVFCCLLAVPVAAAGEGSISMDTASGKEGDTVTLNVNLDSNPGLVTMTIKVKYKTSVLQLINVSDSGLLVGSALNPNYGSPYTISWVDGTAATNNTKTGTIATFTFKILDGAAIGDSEVTLEFSDSYDTDGNANNFSASSGKVTVTCVHSFGDSEKVDENTHKYTCTKCQEVFTEDHDWNDGVVTAKPTCTEPGQEKYTCLICRAEKNKVLSATGHKFDDACDTDCNNGCGETRTVEHNYSDIWSNDDTGHWHACKTCGNKKDFAAHTPGPEATSTSAQLCEICKYEIAPALSHTHQMGTQWDVNDEEHWHSCQVPGCTYVEDQEVHEFDSDCDMLCDTCGYTRQTAPHHFDEGWVGDSTGHWHMCLDCHAASEVVPHTPGPEATDTEHQICLDCGIIIKMRLDHVHDYGDLWMKDENTHWQCCQTPECIETTAMEPHQWDAGVTLENGDVQYTCTICAHQIITAGEEPPTVPSVPPTQAPTVPQQGEDNNQVDKNGYIWLLVGIAAIVLLLIGILLLVIEFIRSRKTNSHGKYSK